MNSLDSKVEDFTEIAHEPISESQNNHLTLLRYTHWWHWVPQLSTSVTTLLTEALFKATWPGLAEKCLCVEATAEHSTLSQNKYQELWGNVHSWAFGKNPLSPFYHTRRTYIDRLALCWRFCPKLTSKLKRPCGASEGECNRKCVLKPGYGYMKRHHIAPAWVVLNLA